MSPFKQFVENLSMREKWVLGSGLVLTLAILAYALILEPWSRELDRLRSTVPQNEHDLQWMREHVDLAIRLRERKATKGPQGGASLLSIVEKTAHTAKVPIRQINPGSDGEVKIWFRETEFDPWLLWLETLRKKGIEVTNASIDRAHADKVNIRLTVRSGGM